jgi:hypothetical protein
MIVIDLLLKIPAFRKALIQKAFKLTYVDRDEWAKTEHAFTDSKGRNYRRYIRPEWMPLARYEQMQIRLQEMESRIGRESLLEFSKAQRAAAEKKDFITVARLVGELEKRLDVLYDPQLMMRFVSGLYIREDQMKTSHIWNDAIEEEKYKQLLEDNESGSLSFFFAKSDLMSHVRFSDGSNTDSQKLLSEPIVRNQLKEVRLFDQMVKDVMSSISGQKS